jgi:hypothetical protein
MAAQQALRLCEADLPRLTWDTASPPYGGGRQFRISVIATKTALRAAGMSPHAAAALRHRQRLIPEQETRS